MNKSLNNELLKCPYHLPYFGPLVSVLWTSSLFTSKKSFIELIPGLRCHGPTCWRHQIFAESNPVHSKSGNHLLLRIRTQQVINYAFARNRQLRICDLLVRICIQQVIFSKVIFVFTFQLLFSFKEKKWLEYLSPNAQKALV